MKCKICASPSEAFSSATILGKYEITYYACCSCQFIQTQDPHWLKEAYLNPINSSDVGYVSRNVYFSKLTKALIVTLFNSSSRFIDYGGGYGMFVRLMRDLGFDFQRSDKYCENLFAQGLEAEDVGQKQYELLTAFELFEHLPDPLAEIEKMLSFSESLFFSTELQPAIRPFPNKWCYYGLDHGQHVSFYTLSSLKVIASQFGLNLYSNGRLLHLLTKKHPSRLFFNLATRNKPATLLNAIIHRPSLIVSDHKDSLERKKAIRRT